MHSTSSRRRAATFGGVAVITVTLLAGCTADSPIAEPPSAKSPSPSPSASPAATSGELSQIDLPKPSAFGRGWKYRVDPGSSEDGYLGSGQPAIARDPTEVVSALTPLGCRPAELPIPQHALEVTYRKSSTPGVGLLLQFADTTTAQIFFKTHTANLIACAQRNRSPVRIQDRSTSTIEYQRTELPSQSLTWKESINVQGNRVLFVARAAGAKP